MTPRPLGPCFLALLLGCSSARYSSEPGGPSLVMPAAFAEGSEQPGKGAPPSLSSAPAGSASSSPAPSGPVASSAPDPTPLRMAEQVEYDLELAEGKVRVVSVKVVKLKEPIVTPRRMGRYAVELGIGQELIERVRFDFPGTAADEPTPAAKKSLREPLDLGSRAIARFKLLLPHSSRVRRALLVDRALGTVQELEWPLPVVAASAAPAPAASSAPPQP